MDHIPKEKLKDRKYYKGKCKDDVFAIWIAEIQMFLHKSESHKFGGMYAQAIKTIDDEPKRSSFVPF